MEISKPIFPRYLFVCENKKAEGVCCSEAGEKLRAVLKETVKNRGLAHQIRVSRSGCQDVCAEGPNVLLMPDGVWFKRVCEKDVEEIVRIASGG